MNDSRRKRGIESYDPLEGSPKRLGTHGLHAPAVELGLSQQVPAVDVIRMRRGVAAHGVTGGHFAPLEGPIGPDYGLVVLGQPAGPPYRRLPRRFCFRSVEIADPSVRCRQAVVRECEG